MTRRVTCECGGGLRYVTNARCQSCRYPAREPRHVDGGYEIPLTRGRFALIDEADLPLVEGHRWQAGSRDNNTYAVCRDRTFVGYMHRLILGPAADGLQVDHINGNGLDNRRANLRPATNGQNSRNSGKSGRGKTSRFKGVWRVDERHFAVMLGTGSGRYIGRFTSEIQAAKAYDRVAVKKYGEFARTNEAMFGPLDEKAVA